jgi:hypothetical protein
MRTISSYGDSDVAQGASKMDIYLQVSCLDLDLNIIISSPQILNLFNVNDISAFN